MITDGSNMVQVTDAKKGYAFHPRYSPDGRKIVFDFYKKDKKDNDIYIIDVDGNNLTQVTINKSYDGQPYWTSDGYLYFVSDRGAKAGNRQIWRFKL
jgi:TolB protein